MQRGENERTHLLHSLSVSHILQAAIVSPPSFTARQDSMITMASTAAVHGRCIINTAHDN